jgi:uncharacterized membrane protein
MLVALQRALRHAVYGLRGGFLVRPLVVAFALGAFGVLLPWGENALGVLERLFGSDVHVLARDAGTAQAVLGSVLSAVMTVVSIVLSVLLVALTLASMQFSPRILTGFVEDRANQRTIGIFLGTFLYCLGAYPWCRPGARSSVYATAVLGATLLAVTCAIRLVAFIHHIARSINVSFITERIAEETERVIDEVMPTLVSERARAAEPLLPSFEGSSSLVAKRSGYIRFIDAERLRDQATENDLAVKVERRVGQFVTAGIELLRFSKAKDVDADAFLEAVDLGPVRTMEQDIEFGALQLVDIALKAISPAVNDPSTAINCIDQIGRILVRVALREPLPRVLSTPEGVARVVLSPLLFEGLLEVAFSQIAHYARADFAVTLRVLRALDDVSQVARYPPYLEALRGRAESVARECAGTLPASSRAAVQARLDAVVARATGSVGAAWGEP